MKNKLCGIGEALIDFIPEVKGQRLKDVPSFKRVAGGAPANVVGAVTKLGIPSKFLTKLGDDPFGDYIVEVLDEAGIDTSNIARDKEGETALAFVSLASDGNRDFKFYRKNSADLRYSVEDIPADILNDCGMIHFCSVDLVESPMKEAHKKLIDMAIAQNVKVSFDPNLRFSLWDDLDQLKETVNDFLKYADIIKISDEELEFITGHTDIKDALDGLFADRAKYVIYTKGADGAEVYTRNGMVEASGYKIDVRDTTGAGDSFIGAFLYCLLNDEVEDLESVSDDTLRNYLDFANAYAANTTTKEWVDALNTIDVVFQENKKVRHAWREYLDSLNEKSPHFDSSNSFRLDLLSEMAVSLGYKNLKQTEIDRFYSPKYFGSQMSRQEILFQENLRILTRSKSCAESFTDEEYEQHYKELMEQQGE